MNLNHAAKWGAAPDEKRKLKVLYVGERHFFGLFRKASEVGRGGCVYRIVFPPDMPEDVVVERVIHDPRHAAWALLLSHESFDEVPEYMEIPAYEMRGINLLVVEDRSVKVKPLEESNGRQ